MNWNGSLYSFSKRCRARIWTRANSSWSLRKVTCFDIDSVDNLGLFSWCGWWIIVLVYVVWICWVCVRIGIDGRCMGSVIFSPWTENSMSSLSTIFGSIFFWCVNFIIWRWRYSVCIISSRIGDFCGRWIIVIGNSCTWRLYSLYSYRLISLWLIIYCLVT